MLRHHQGIFCFLVHGQGEVALVSCSCGWMLDRMNEMHQP
jgi:hypothetical protein